jgi:glycosyltransferase involved in cell wall biosynthesis
VHVMPSWFETTGLVSLEAALAGCNVVSTSRGHAREYLGDLAWYCQPDDPTSIRSAVQAAWNAPARPALRERILSEYTWRHAAIATLMAYDVVSRRTVGDIGAQTTQRIHRHDPSSDLCPGSNPPAHLD